MSGPMWITPSMGVAPDGETDAGIAVAQIVAGGDAFVADEQVARAVLRRLGLTDFEVEDRLHFANTGTVL